MNSRSEVYLNTALWYAEEAESGRGTPEDAVIKASLASTYASLAVFEQVREQQEAGRESGS